MTAEGQESGASSVSPWRTRDFRLVWTGGFVNDIGDWLLLVALPVYVFTKSGSGTATAILFVVELAAALILGPIGGSLVDRWDLRRTLIATNMAQAVTLLPLLAVTADRIWPAYIVVGAQAMLMQINNPASAAMVPRVVKSDQLTVANAANSTSQSLARLSRRRRRAGPRMRIAARRISTEPHQIDRAARYPSKHLHRVRRARVPTAAR